MSHDWCDFLDFQSKERVHYFSEQDIGSREAYDRQLITLTDSRVESFLKSDVERYVLQHDDVAITFLGLISNAQLNIYGQQSIIRLLGRLHESCHQRRKRSAALILELTKTLDLLPGLMKKIARKFNIDLEIDEQRYAEYLPLGNGEYAIRYGLGIARAAALLAFVKGFADRFAANERPTDLVGEWHLKASELLHQELTVNIAGVYGMDAHAKVVKVPRRAVWEIKFLDFPPLDRTWYTLEEAAYEAAAPIVARALYGKVVAVGKLWD